MSTTQTVEIIRNSDGSVTRKTTTVRKQGTATITRVTTTTKAAKAPKAEAPKVAPKSTPKSAKKAPKRAPKAAPAPAEVKQFTLVRNSGKNRVELSFDTFAKAMETFCKMRNYVLENMALMIDAHTVNNKAGTAHFAARGCETRPDYRYNITITNNG